MNKREFINELSTVLNLSKTETDKTVAKIFEVVIKNLSKDEEVNLPGFGKFFVTHKAGRAGRNPLTGKELKISARSVAAFKASSVLKALIFEKVKYKAPNKQNKKKE